MRGLCTDYRILSIGQWFLPSFLSLRRSVVFLFHEALPNHNRINILFLSVWSSLQSPSLWNQPDPTETQFIPDRK